MDLAPLIAGLVLGLAVGVGATLVARRGAVAAAVLRVRGEEQRAAGELRVMLAAEQARVEGLTGQLGALERRAREDAERRGREDGERLDRERAESRVLQALAPVQQSLREMQGKVGEIEQQRAAQYGAIEHQLLATRQTSEQVRDQAGSLAAALRNTSVRGSWGEAQLRRLVESAGLTNRVDFDMQVTTRSDDGVRRPDLVVRLPEGRCIAVDAKVPLAAFIEANEIPAGAVGAEGARREALMKDHVKALRAHIDALASKGYWTEFHSPEFVVAFLPSESLLSAALAADPSLLDYSFGKRVALASPVNLWAVLKTVAFTWTQQALTEDAARLFELSRALYDRLAVLAGHAEKLRASIERTVTAYNDFAGSLETRVLVTGRQINRMDESKILGEPRLIDTAPRPFTAPELAAS